MVYVNPATVQDPQAGDKPLSAWARTVNESLEDVHQRVLTTDGLVVANSIEIASAVTDITTLAPPGAAGPALANDPLGVFVVIDDTGKLRGSYSPTAGYQPFTYDGSNLTEFTDGTDGSLSLVEKDGNGVEVTNQVARYRPRGEDITIAGTGSIVATSATATGEASDVHLGSILCDNLGDSSQIFLHCWYQEAADTGVSTFSEAYGSGIYVSPNGGTSKFSLSDSNRNAVDWNQNTDRPYQGTRIYSRNTDTTFDFYYRTVANSLTGSNAVALNQMKIVALWGELYLEA